MSEKADGDEYHKFPEDSSVLETTENVIHKEVLEIGVVPDAVNVKKSKSPQINRFATEIDALAMTEALWVGQRHGSDDGGCVSGDTDKLFMFFHVVVFYFFYLVAGTTILSLEGHDSMCKKFNITLFSLDMVSFVATLTKYDAPLTNVGFNLTIYQAWKICFLFNGIVFLPWSEIVGNNQNIIHTPVGHFWSFYVFLVLFSSLLLSFPLQFLINIGLDLYELTSYHARKVVIEEGELFIKCNSRQNSEKLGAILTNVYKSSKVLEACMVGSIATFFISTIWLFWMLFTGAELNQITLLLSTSSVTPFTIVICYSTFINYYLDLIEARHNISLEEIKFKLFNTLVIKPYMLTTAVSTIGTYVYKSFIA